MISGKSLAKNFTIQALGKIVAVMIGLFIMAILTRYLGAERFGEYTTAITFLQFFGVVVDFGLTLTLIVMISKSGADESNIAGNFLGLRLVSGFLLFSLAPLLVLLFPWSQTIEEAVLVGALAYFFMGGATLLVGVFQRHESMWRSALAELINRLVLLLITIIFIVFQFGVVAMMTALVITNFVWLMAMIVYAKPFVHVVPRFDWMIWRRIFSQSWPMAISILFNLMYLKGDILFLAFFRTQTEVGLYGAAYRVLDVLTVLPTMLMGLLLPSFVHAWSAGDHERVRARIARIFDLLVMMCLPIIIGTGFIGVELITFIAGKEFAVGGIVLQILMLAVLGIFLGALFGHLVVAINKQRVMIWGYAAVALLTILGYIWAVPRYGMWGAAWMTVFSESVIAIITFAMVQKTIHIPFRTSGSLKTLIASFAMGAVLYVMPPMHVLVDLVVAGAVYVVCLLCLKAISMRELQSLIAKT